MPARPFDSAQGEQKRKHNPFSEAESKGAGQIKRMTTNDSVFKETVSSGFHLKAHTWKQSNNVYLQPCQRKRIDINRESGLLLPSHNNSLAHCSPAGYYS